MAFFFFIWQIPHFWLLLMRIGDDYRRAGLPTLTRSFHARNCARVTFVWMMATAVACLVFHRCSALPHRRWVYAGFLVGVGVARVARDRDGAHGGERLAFHHINLYALIVISLLSISGLRG